MTRLPSTPRHGLSTLMAIFALTMLFICAVFAYSVFVTRDSYIELRNASHATSLAGVGALAHDDLLTNDTQRVLDRISAARTTAVQVGVTNQVGPHFFSMNPLNPTNDPAGNLVFGRLTAQLGGTFTPLFPLPASADPFPFDSALLNAVRVDAIHPTRPGVHVRMYAHIDHNILGFKPTNALTIPVVPIALFSDTAVIPAQKTFENALLTAVDSYALNYTTLLFGAGTDGIAEIRFEYGIPSGDTTVITSKNLVVGTTTWAEIQAQILTGISKTQVTAAPFNGQFALTSPGPSLTVTEFLPPPLDTDFAAGFAPIGDVNAAVPRIFPLYSSSTGTDVVLSGFIAARVARIDTSVAGRVTVTLQPTMLTTPLAVNPSTCPAPATTFNRYLGKLRLAAVVNEYP